jgi:transketolase C-terminal domain/subunit
MKKYTDSGSKDTRSGFGAGLEELGKTNENVVALCADLTGSLKMNAFADQNPDRFYQVGIAEANMMGIAAGLTIGGKSRSLEPLRTSLRVACTIKSVRASLTVVKTLKSVLLTQA